MSSRPTIFEQISLNGSGSRSAIYMESYQFLPIDNPKENSQGFFCLINNIQIIIFKNLRVLGLFSNRIFIKYILIPAIPLFLLTVIAVDPYLWISSEIHHFYIELFAVIFSGVIAFYYILYARNLNDKFSLFIGIGISVSALIDLLHMAVSYSLMENSDFLKYFIPQTWFAGRIFLSSMLLIAIAKYSSLFPEELVSSKIEQSDTQKNQIIQKSPPLNINKKIG